MSPNWATGPPAFIIFTRGPPDVNPSSTRNRPVSPQLGGGAPGGGPPRKGIIQLIGPAVPMPPPAALATA
jgi:hypothetical protein